MRQVLHLIRVKSVIVFPTSMWRDFNSLWPQGASDDVIGGSAQKKAAKPFLQSLADSLTIFSFLP